MKNLFIVISFLCFNPEVYGQNLKCRQSLQKEKAAPNSKENKSPEQKREGNYLVNHLRDKYPITLDAEREKALIIKYQATGDPEVLERILSSIILIIWKIVKKVLLRSLHYDPSLADDLLQEAVMNIKTALKNYDITRPERFMTYFGKALEPSLVELLYKYKSAVRFPKGSNGKLPISIHAEFEDGMSLEDSLPDLQTISAEQRIAREQKIAKIHADIKTILPLFKTELERQILQGLLSGFDESGWRRLREQGSITQTQLHTKQNKILRMLRNNLDPTAF